MSEIVTRFPPSPTGYLHVGGARTALFNWLYARHTGGRFILRIEDTDAERSTRESVDTIFEALEWLGIDWDDGPYYQSRRLDVYRRHIDRMVASGHAYHCDCSRETIEAMRARARAEGRKPRYDGTCRSKGLDAGPGTVVRFAAPQGGVTVVEDAVKGNIHFQNDELDDFVICRSDGMPTYNLAVVVDDVTMGVNTVLRGDDHVNNTPKQIQLYHALGADLPVFGHLPMVLGSDRTRLSKRHGATSVTAYRDMGYLPEALLNYLVRLGWSHGDQEFFTVTELIEKFSLDNLGRSPGVFNLEKLQALNADHIQAAAPARLAAALVPHLAQRKIETAADGHLEQIVATLSTRSKTLEEMADAARFYFVEKIEYEEKAVKKVFKPAALDPLRRVTDELESMGDFNEPNLEAAFLKVMTDTGLKLGKIAQPVRVALTGGTVSPGIFETISALGREATLARLHAAVRFLEARK